MAKAQKAVKPTDALRVEKNIYSRYCGESFQVKMSHGAHKINKTFDTLEQARSFRDGVNYKSSTDVISQTIFKGIVDRRTAASFTFADALDKYETDYAEKKRGADPEVARVHRIKVIAVQLNIANKALILIDKGDVESILAVVKAGKPRKDGGIVHATSNDNVRRYIAILRHLFNVARQNKEWGIPMDNPIQRGDFAVPDANPPRNRRLNEGEWNRLKSAFEAHDAADVYTFALAIVETGMRRGEALKATWQHVDLEERSIYLPAAITKTNEARNVGLSIRAVDAIKSLTRGIGGATIFPSSLTPGRIRTQWLRACNATGVKNLRLYDLRHEAISRMAENGKMSQLETQKQAGHKDPRMTLRYVQLNTKLVGEKLD